MLKDEIRSTWACLALSKRLSENSKRSQKSRARVPAKLIAFATSILAIKDRQWFSIGSRARQNLIVRHTAVLFSITASLPYRTTAGFAHWYSTLILRVGDARSKMALESLGGVRRGSTRTTSLYRTAARFPSPNARSILSSPIRLSRRVPLFDGYRQVDAHRSPAGPRNGVAPSPAVRARVPQIISAPCSPGAAGRRDRRGPHRPRPASGCRRSFPSRSVRRR